MNKENIDLNKINKEVNRIFPKNGKYLTFILAVIFLIVTLFMHFTQVKMGKYIKEEYGENVYNIFVDNKLIEATRLVDNNGVKELRYLGEDSGKIEIEKDEDKYLIFVISSINNEKILLYPPIEIEKQNPDTLYKVSRVVDGDTIKIKYNDKNETIRLIGIDTPESVHADSNKNIEEGQIASDYTQDRLEGKEIKLEFDVQPRDKYGRLLAYVYIDGKMFNEELLKKGYARLLTYPPNVKYSENFKIIQSKAIKLDKGFWKNNIWDKEQ